MASHFNGSSLKDLQDDLVLSANIASRMHVPKRISVLGGEEDDILGGNGNRYRSNSESRFEMKVPERILVVGQDRHVGMKAPPHELVLENSILPVEPYPTVRVKTPPRSITVSSIPDNNEETEPEEESEEEETKPEKEIVLISDKNDSSFMEPPQLTLTSTQLTEEVFVLRQQIGRLHRRMAVFEREQHQRQQRDALMVSLGAVYLVWKVILWLTRST